MILLIADVIDTALLRAVREAGAEESIWGDGAATAAGRAKEVKQNQQARALGPAKGVLDTLAGAILDHAVVKNAAVPAALARIILTRYRSGMSYGAHVDAPYIDGVRTDLSFTLFLSNPGDYDGGELVVDSAGAEDTVKLPAGSLVLYPSSSVHRVAAVTRGERLACVGWIKSRVRSGEARALLLEISRIEADLSASGAPPDVRDRLGNVRNALLRFWGE